uniref:Uncharacterized protein n=1 Tax=Cacopsylla melanoneura TaxID=428564 RepID=A0A8D8S045_9HEMI
MNRTMNNRTTRCLPACRLGVYICLTEVLTCLSFGCVSVLLRCLPVCRLGVYLCYCGVYLPVVWVCICVTVVFTCLLFGCVSVFLWCSLVFWSISQINLECGTGAII